MRSKTFLSLLTLALAAVSATMIGVAAEASPAVDGTVVDRGSPDEAAAAAAAAATAPAAGAGAVPTASDLIDDEDGYDDEDDDEANIEGMSTKAILAVLAEEGLIEPEEIAAAEAATQTPEELEELRKQGAAWEGHMKPLASVNTLIPVDKVEATITPAEFFSKYVRESTPVVIRGGALSFPATSLWTDEYLSAAKGATDVDAYVEPGLKEDRVAFASRAPISSTLAKYITDYTAPGFDAAYASDVIPSLKKDLSVPVPLQCPALSYSFVRAVLRLDNGNVRSALHLEQSDEVLCVLDGTRRVVLLNPLTSDEYVSADAVDAAQGEFVAIDVDAVDAAEHPGLSKVAFHEAKLSKGDCLFIPALWLHAFTTPAGARASAVSFWWAHSPDVEDSIVAGDCSLPIDHAAVVAAATAEAVAAAATANAAADAVESLDKPAVTVPAPAENAGAAAAAAAGAEVEWGSSKGWGLDLVELSDEAYIYTPAERSVESLRARIATEDALNEGLKRMNAQDDAAEEAAEAAAEAAADAELEGEGDGEGEGEGEDEEEGDLGMAEMFLAEENAAAEAAVAQDEAKAGLKDEL